MKSTKLQTGFRRWVSLVMAAMLAASLLCMGQPVVAQGLTQQELETFAKLCNKIKDNLL